MALRLACLFLSLLLVVLSSASNAPEPPYPLPDFVYRADFREPQLIFQTGMQSHGKCENVFYHVQGRNCKAKTSAFISTTSEEYKAKYFAGVLLQGNPKKQSISVYKIRADQRFYSAIYSLETAAVAYLNKGKQKKAEKYIKLADQYEDQKEWMAYREIPTTLIQQATTYNRQHLVNENEKAIVSPNPNYIAANTVANQQPFPESEKGCLPGFMQSLKACVLSDHELKKRKF